MADVTFEIGFQINQKDISSQLGRIQDEINKALTSSAHSGDWLTTEITSATKAAATLKTALEKATSINGTSLVSFNAQLAKMGMTSTGIITGLAAGGQQFANSFNEALIAISTANRNAITLGKTLEGIKYTLVQSFKYSLASSAYRAISQSLRSAITWTKQLNKELTAIQAVANKTAGQMDKIYENTLKGAKELRIAATEYAKASYIFYQQGLGDEEVTRRTEITIKAAKAAGQEMEQMASQLTAIWNTYQMGADQQEHAASVGARLAAETAVDFADIAEAMSSSASAAAQMGVSYESLAAIIATTGDVTQQSASVVGNAYKTIFSRFEQLKAEGTDGEVTLNRVSAQLQQLGINVLDLEGNLRPLDDVIQETGEHWGQWSQKQQVAIAELVGGTRQYGQFLALMNNFDKYQKNLKSAKSEGTDSLEQQYKTQMESLDELAAQSAEAWKQAFKSIIDEDVLKALYKGLKTFGDGLGDILSTFGGIKSIALFIAGIFAKDMAQGLSASLVYAKGIADNLQYTWGTGTQNWEENQKARIDKQYAVYGNNISALSGNNVIGGLDADTVEIEREKLQISKDIAKIEVTIEAAKKNQNVAAKEALEQQRIALQERERNVLSLRDSTFSQRQDLLTNFGIRVNENTLDLSLSNNQIAHNIQMGSGPIAADVDAYNAAHQALIAYLQDLREYRRLKQGIESDTKIDSDTLAKSAKSFNPDDQQKLLAFQKSVQGLISGMTSLAMAMTQVSNIATQLGTAVEGDNIDVGKLMTSIVFLIPMILNVGKAVKTMYEQISSGSMAASITSGIGLVLVLIGVIYTAIKAVKDYRKAKIETRDKLLTEQIEKEIELSKAIEDQSKALEENKKAWEEAKISAADATEEYQALADTVNELTNNLIEAGAASGEVSRAKTEFLTTGNTDRFNKLIAEQKSKTTNNKVSATNQHNENKIQLYNIEHSMATGKFADVEDFLKTYRELEEKSKELSKDAEKNEQQLKLINNKLSVMKDTYEEIMDNNKQAISEWEGYLKSTFNGKDFSSAGFDNLQTVLTSYYDQVYVYGQQIKATDEEIEQSFRNIIATIPELNRALAISDRAMEITEKIQKAGNSIYSGEGNSSAYENELAKWQNQYNKAQEKLGKLGNSAWNYNNALDPANIFPGGNTQGYITKWENAYDEAIKAKEEAEKVLNDFDAYALENGIEKAIDVTQKKIYDFFKGLSDEDTNFMLNANIAFVDDKEDLQQILDGYHDLKLRVGIDLETEQITKEKIGQANLIQDTLKDAIKEFQEDGEISTDTAYKLMEEGYSKYVALQGDKFGLSENAAQDFNHSLEDELKNVKKLYTGLSDLKQPMSDFLNQMISFKGTIDNPQLEEFYSRIIDIGVAFTKNGGAEGAKEYFDAVSNEIESIGSSLSSINFSPEQLSQFAQTIQSAYSSIGQVLDKAATQVENGTMSAAEYGKLVEASISSVQKIAKVQSNTLATQIELNRRKIEHDNLEKDEIEALETENKKLSDQKALVDEIAAKKFDLSKWIDFAQLMEDNYDALTAIFNEDYSLKIDYDALTEATEQGKLLSNVLNTAFDSYSNMADASNTALAQVLGGFGKTIDDVEQSGKGLFNYLRNELNVGEQGIQSVMNAIQSDYGNQLDTAAQEFGNLVDGISDLINNIDYTFTIDPEGEGLRFQSTDNGFQLVGNQNIRIQGHVSEGASEKTQAALETIKNSAKAMFAAKSAAEVMSGLSSWSSKPQGFANTPFNTTDDDKGSKAEANYIKRYENIERQLDKMTKAANRYKKAADDAFGKTKIVALQKYEQELQKMGELNQQYLKDAQRYQKIDQSALEQKIASAGGPQVTYDSNGRVNNAEAIREYWENAVNNSGSEAVKEVADDVIKLLDRLLGSEDKIEDVWDKSLDNIRDFMSNKLDIVKQQIERAEKIADTEIKRFEMMNDLLGDMALSDGSKFKNLKGVFEQNVSKSTSISTATDRLLDIQKNIESGSKHEQWFKDQFGPEAWDAYISGNGAVPAELEDMLREQLESLMDLATEMKQNLADMFEAFRDTLQFFLDQYDDIAKEMKNNFQSLDRLEAIMDATSFGKTKEGLETKAKISKAREEQTQRDIDLAKSKRNTAKVALDQAEAVVKAAMNGKKSIDDLTDAEKIAYDVAINEYKKARDTFYQTEEDLTEALNNGLEQAKETLEIMNQLAEKAFSDKIGGFSLDSLKDEYDMQKTMDNFYLDAYEKEYSLSKLENEIAEQMKDIDDPSRLKAWGEFQDKLNGLRADGVELTQDEYEILEAEFELEKLRDQYEEAKNAKNTMRLARDASGNYSYVYSSNSKEVNKLAQQIKDAEHNIYEMHKNISQKMQDSWWELQEWYKNNIENYDKELYETDAKYKAYIDSWQAYYETMNARYSQQITTHTEAIGWTFQDTATGKVLPAFIYMDDAASGFRNAFEGYKQDLVKANGEYLESVKSMAESVGIKYGELTTTVEKEIEDINLANDALIDKLTGKEGVEAAAKKAMKDIGEDLANFVTKDFLPQMDTILEKIKKVNEALTALENRPPAKVDVDTPENDEDDGGSENGGGGGSGGGGTGGGSGGFTYSKAEYSNAKSQLNALQVREIQIAMGVNSKDGDWGPESQKKAFELYDGMQNARDVYLRLLKEGKVTSIESGNTIAKREKLTYMSAIKNSSGQVIGYVIKTASTGSKSIAVAPEAITGPDDHGNYFVEQGHQIYKATASGGLISTPQIRSLAEEGPELVLNAEDTKNILATVKMMREVVARQSNAVRGTDFASRVSSDFFNQHQTVDQDVKIEATFPNVSMASEIEAAFNNLINEAVQYATRR